MADSLAPTLRYKLLLGKFVVEKVDRPLGVLRVAIRLPGLGLMICDVPPSADVREGDLLTLYTEILAHAPAQHPSIQ